MKKFIVSTLTAGLIIGGSVLYASAAEWTYDENTATINITASGALNDGDAWSSKLKTAKHIVVSEGVTSIGVNVFMDCGTVEDITLPEGITSIGDHAFALSRNLKSINLPSSLTKLGEEVFAECSSLKSITIPANLTSFNANAFTECTSISAYSVAPENTSYTAVDGVLFSKDKSTLVAYPNGKAGTSYSIPDGTVNIGKMSFNYNSTLNTITLPNSVSSIGDKAFFYCKNLNDIVFGNGLKSIGESAFYGNSCSVITVPYGTETIGNSAFKNCHSLSLLDIPNTVKNIGSNITYGCFNNLKIGCYGNSAASKYAASNSMQTQQIVRVVLNGKELVFDSPATIINDCTMVPMRKIFEELGATVSWDGNTQTASGTKDGTTISFKIGDASLNKNGQSVALEAPAVIINERTLVHVRAIAESFGANVGWDGTNGLVSINL